jgi:hypothetical protein
MWGFWVDLARNFAVEVLVTVLLGAIALLWKRIRAGGARLRTYWASRDGRWWEHATPEERAHWVVQHGGEAVLERPDGTSTRIIALR